MKNNFENSMTNGESIIEKEHSPAEDKFIEFREEMMDVQWELNEEKMKENSDKDKVIELDEKNREYSQQQIKEVEVLTESGSDQQKILEIIDKNIQDPKWQEQHKSLAKEWYSQSISSALEKVSREMSKLEPGMPLKRKENIISEDIQPAIKDYENIKEQSRGILTSLEENDFKIVEEYVEKLRHLTTEQKELLG